MLGPGGSSAVWISVPCGSSLEAASAVGSARGQALVDLDDPNLINAVLVMQIRPHRTGYLGAEVAPILEVLLDVIDPIFTLDVTFGALLAHLVRRFAFPFDTAGDHYAWVS